ncbi:MAG: HD domain-containing protein [Candidatus Liptonbacteria bacterium]|nr:HD domain-containing protein [Candidatus Liptonbacteria bacterium]
MTKRRNLRLTNDQKIANFLFEAGTLRKLSRVHRQTLLSDDMSDNIASHSFRVALIAWALAKKEKVDPYKVVMMALTHDLGEARSNDHNWVHKRYVKIFNDEIIEEQLSGLPFGDVHVFAQEYEARKTKEAVIAKDADLLDEILLLREYEWQGNREAVKWLYEGKGKLRANAQLKKLKLKSAKELGKTIYETEPSAWWDNLWTSKNR